MKATTKKGFEWNAETLAEAVKLYKAQLEIDATVANSNDFLGSIAKAIGAKSAQAVRSKLAAAKEYVKPDAPRSVRGTVRTQKAHFIRALQQVAKDNDVELTGRKFESLESATGADLQLVVTLLEAATGETIEVNPQAKAASVPKQETAKA